MNIAEQKKQCPNIASNMQYCNCSYDGCSKKGLCCQCIHYHRSNGQLPACYFDTFTEKTYDRSIENFIKQYQKK